MLGDIGATGRRKQSEPECFVVQDEVLTEIISEKVVERSRFIHKVRSVVRKGNLTLGQIRAVKSFQ